MEWNLTLTVYEIIGMLVVWLGFIYAMLKFGWAFLELIIEVAKDHFRTIWYFIEFVLYRKKFLEWVKDKPRSKGPKKYRKPKSLVCDCSDENWVYDESGVDMYCKKCADKE